MDWLATTLSSAATLALMVIVWWPIRLAIANRIERRFEETHPRDTAGYILGAAPLLLRGTRPGAVLLLHGFNDSPQAMSSLATALHNAGWTVRVPALPGHGRTLREFAQARAVDWESAARAELQQLLLRYAHVAVCGMSMGGALASILAAEEHAVRAVVVLAPYLQHGPKLRLLHLFGPIASLGARWLASGGRGSVRDPEAARQLIAYRMTTPRLLHELFRVTSRADAALERIHQPVLMLQSREDHRIPVSAAERAFARIGSQDKTLEWVTGAGHVLSVDYGHEQLEQRIVEWLQTRMT